MIGRRKRRRGSLLRRIYWSIVLLGLVIAGWGAGLVWFVGQMPSETTDDLRPAEAIVVLTGGQDRLSRGFDLLSAGKAAKLFISGVYRGLDVRALLEMSQQSPDELECCIELGYAAPDTIGNAMETGGWVKRNNISSIILVTAHYHVPRSMLEFRDAMPDVDIQISPVFPDNVRRDDWWQWSGTARLYAAEYSKYLFARLRRLVNRTVDRVGEAM